MLMPLFSGAVLPLIVLLAGSYDMEPAATLFQIRGQWDLGQHGGAPFVADLDLDGEDEVLWLQSPGLFHSKVFDTDSSPGKFSDAERDLFCLTATDGDGEVLWQVGEPWTGDRPFVSHSAERALDCADIDGDGVVEVVCVRRGEILVIDAQTGAIERSVTAPADNAQIVRIGKTGPGPADYKILVKNAERAYPPHEYANPAWFYSNGLELLATQDYLGAGHAPLAVDVDGDGCDEFVIGFNLVDHDLSLVWTFRPVPPDQWVAAEMHVDGVAIGEVGGVLCLAYAASDVAYLVNARTGDLLWKRQSTHPQHCQIGRFYPDLEGNQVFVHNKRAELRLCDPKGDEVWTMSPPENFPLGMADACRRQKFHVFDPVTVVPGLGPENTDVLVFTDSGWPYVIDGRGQRVAEFPMPASATQDWGEVTGRPDDYGYGYYARVLELDGDEGPEVLINDRRFAWIYEPVQPGERLGNGIVLPAEWPPEYSPDVASVLMPPWLTAPPCPIAISVGRQLFVDDFLIQETDLTRTYHALDPYEGNPVLAPDRPWESEGEWKDKHGAFAIPFSDGVWYDPAVRQFKMWYMAGLLNATCLAVSQDGIQWEKPELDVKPGTNIVHTGNRDSASLWLDHYTDDPASRFKLARFQKSPRRGFVLHYSPDGVHWSDEIAWAGPCHDRTTAFYNPFRNVWAVSAKAMLPPEPPYESRVRRYHEGPTLLDAFKWEKYESPSFWIGRGRPDPKSPEGFVKCEVYNLDAVAYESLMLGLFAVHTAPGDEKTGRPKQNQVYLGFSRDGFHWYRPDTGPFIGVSDEQGAWNWGNVQSVGGGCLIVGDQLYVYFSGRAGGMEFCDANASTGLGFLRRDGFASMDAGPEEGFLTTRPIVFKGTHLFINAAMADGELRVEVLDGDGEVVEPYSAANCHPMKTDSTRYEISWNGADGLSALAGTPVRFRFHVKSGSLYAFWVSPDESGASQGYVAAGGPGFEGPIDVSPSSE